jgi:hypothetical protein
MTTLAMDYQMGFMGLDRVFTPSAYVRTWNRSLPVPLYPSSASISASIDRALTFVTSQNTVIEDQLAVEAFLANNSGVVAHLYSIPEKIAYYIGKSEMKLGVFSEPDGYEVPELYLEVETSLSPEEANARLSTLNREWILASTDEDLVSLNITLKFT